MKTKSQLKNILILICGLIIFHTCSSQRTIKKDWKSDLNYILKELPKKHYDLFAVKSKDYYSQGIKNILISSDSLSDFEIAIQLQQLIASMGDSHTRVDVGQYIDRNKVLPLHLYWFTDGFYILHTTPENEEILGKRLVSINQVPIEIIIDSLSTLITVDNKAIVKSSIPKIIPSIQILEYFRFVKDQEINLGLENVEGEKEYYTIEPSLMTRDNRVVFKPDSLAICFRNERAYFIDYYLPNDRTYYIQYNKCWSRELERKYGKGNDNINGLPSFSDFEKKVFQTLEVENIEKIIFDLRFNGGGNSSQGTKFIESFAIYANRNPEKEIFVVLGRHTFSSAILNAMDFKRLTSAVFIGEETGGKPNHFGEIKKFKLPFSGLRVDYSTKYFQRSIEDINSLKPDIEIELNFNDFKRGIDPVYNWIIKK